MVINFLPGTSIPKAPGFDEAVQLLNDHAQATGEGFADNAVCPAGFHWWTRVRWWPPENPHSIEHMETCPAHRRT